MNDAGSLSVLIEARDWVAEGDTEHALDLLLPLLSGLAQNGERGWSDLRNDAILSARAIISERREARRGIMTREEVRVAATRNAGAILGLIDDIVGRLNRIGGPIPAQAEPEAPLLLGEVEGTPQDIIGRDNLKSIAWLAKGLAVSRAVCRILTPRRSGTGFHIGGGRIVTNHHVVPDAQTAAESKAEFNFQRGPDGQMETSTLLRATMDGFAAVPKPLDCAVLHVPEAEGAFPELQLAGMSAPEIGTPVSIIQHPLSGEKQIAVTSNEVVAAAGARLVYLTDTLAGSSGAPVFDDAWQVVGLHRAGGGTTRLADGRLMRGNEGVLISALLSDATVGPSLRVAIAN